MMDDDRWMMMTKMQRSAVCICHKSKRCTQAWHVFWYTHVRVVIIQNTVRTSFEYCGEHNKTKNKNIIKSEWIWTISTLQSFFFSPVFAFRQFSFLYYFVMSCVLRSTLITTEDREKKNCFFFSFIQTDITSCILFLELLLFFFRLTNSQVGLIFNFVFNKIQLFLFSLFGWHSQFEYTLYTRNEHNHDHDHDVVMLLLFAYGKSFTFFSLSLSFSVVVVIIIQRRKKCEKTLHRMLVLAGGKQNHCILATHADTIQIEICT